jgi:hypothetical protein
MPKRARIVGVRVKDVHTRERCGLRDFRSHDECQGIRVVGSRVVRCDSTSWFCIASEPLVLSEKTPSQELRATDDVELTVGNRQCVNAQDDASSCLGNRL